MKFYALYFHWWYDLTFLSPWKPRLSAAAFSLSPGPRIAFLTWDWHPRMLVPLLPPTLYFSPGFPFAFLDPFGGSFPWIYFCLTLLWWCSAAIAYPLLRPPSGMVLSISSIPVTSATNDSQFCVWTTLSGLVTLDRPWKIAVIGIRGAMRIHEYF